MKTLVKIFTLLLLLINGTGAIYGGWKLMAHPDGSTLQISLDWLEHTPFHNFFIPGMILFIVNGVFSFIALLTILLSHQKSYVAVMIQGILLTGWIVTQTILLREANALHLIFVVIGLQLIYLAQILREIKIEEREKNKS